MSYDRVNPTYYQTYQQGTPFHAGAPGWTQAPFPTWGENPNLAGRRRLATDGLGKVVAISGLGMYMSSNPAEKCPSGSQRYDDSGWCYSPGEWDAVQRARAAKASPPLAPAPPIAPAPKTLSLSLPPPMAPWLRAVSTLAAAVCAYHGYKRNESAGWAVGWAFFGSVAPFLAVPVALAQGFGKPKKMASNRRRRRSARR